MDKSRQQKEREERVLIDFVSNSKIPVVSINDDETPDFYIEVVEDLELFKKKTVSVEVTDLIAQNLKHREALQDRIIDLAKSKFDEKFPDTHLRVYIGFENYFLPNKKREKIVVANQLFEFVLKVHQNNKDFKYRVKKEYNVGIRGVKDISISNDENFTNWQSFGAYLVPYAEEKWLIERILKKNELISKYKKEVDEKWLLIVYNYGSKSSGFQLNKIDLEDYNILFDRIYVYGYMSKDTTRLK